MIYGKSLYSLGLEYYEQAKLLKKQIAARRINLLSESPGSDKARELNTDIKMLYRQHGEAIKTANYLCNYYKTEEKTA